MLMSLPNIIFRYAVNTDRRFEGSYYLHLQVTAFLWTADCNILKMNVIGSFDLSVFTS